MFRILSAVPLVVFTALSSQFFFTGNAGQWPDEILFRSSVPGAQIFLTSRGADVYLDKGDVLQYSLSSSTPEAVILP